MRMTALAIVFAGFASAAAASSVKTDNGLVSGVVANNVESFKGIPYAAPPIDHLRWRAPRPAAAWSGVRAADAFGKACMQEVRGPAPVRAQMSEDCLTLNIFRPAETKKPLPVMVWIHGGGLTTGTSWLPTYDGTAFARGGVVLVSINYRVSRLGFFVHPALTQENADGGHLGNYGLMDQIAALQWVKRNIAAFGGDPTNVTIFGESAGGQSVDALMVTPEARGLFHKAISESGYGRAHFFTRVSQATPDGAKSGEDEGVELAKQWGLDAPDLATLRALPAEKIVDNSPTNGGALSLYLDKTLPEDLWTAFRTGKEAPVPFLLGSNGLEMAQSTNADKTVRLVLTSAEEDQLKTTYGSRPDCLANLTSDILFTQQARAIARLHTKNGHPTYLYLFDVVPAADAATVKGAAHAAEIRYVFDTLGAGAKPIAGVAEEKVAKIMNAQWRTFATTGAPNAAGLPQWPRYDGQQILEYTLKSISAHSDVRNERLDALSRLIDPKS